MQANLKTKAKLQLYNQVKVISDNMKWFHGNSDHFVILHVSTLWISKNKQFSASCDIYFF